MLHLSHIVNSNLRRNIHQTGHKSCGETGAINTNVKKLQSKITLFWQGFQMRWQQGKYMASFLGAHSTGTWVGAGPRAIARPAPQNCKVCPPCCTRDEESKGSLPVQRSYHVRMLSVKKALSTKSSTSRKAFNVYITLHGKFAYKSNCCRFYIYAHTYILTYTFKCRLNIYYLVK